MRALSLQLSVSDMDLAFLQGKAVQKALGFFVMMLFGAYLRTKITDKAQINGIKALIMQGLVSNIIEANASHTVAAPHRPSPSPVTRRSTDTRSQRTV